MPDEHDTYRLSPVQQGMFFHHLHAKNRVYLEQTTARIDGDLDPELFEQTLQHLVRAHECLRVVFVDDVRDGQCQQALPYTPRKLRYRDLSTAPDPDAAFARRAASEMARNFDLRHETSRCELVKLGARRHVFLWTYHHLIMDAWTLKILQEQFCSVYLALSRREVQPEIAGVSYRRYVEWIEHQDTRRGAAYWAGYLDGHGCRTEAELPAVDIDEHRATTVVACGGRSRELLGLLARRHRATINQITLAVWATYVLDHFQRARALFGCVVSGRMISLPEIENIGGLFVNTIPIRVCETDSVTTTISELRQHIVASSEFSFMSLSDMLACGETSPSAITSVINFPFDRRDLTTGAAKSLPFRVHDIRHAEQAHYDLYLDAYAEKELVLAIHHDPRRHAFTAARVREAIVRILEQFARSPDVALGDVRLRAANSALSDGGALDFNRGDGTWNQS